MADKNRDRAEAASEQDLRDDEQQLDEPIVEGEPTTPDEPNDKHMSGLGDATAGGQPIG